MTRWAAWVAVVGVFLVGVTIGALGMHVYDENTAEPWRRPDGPRGGPPPHGRMHRFFEHLATRLELSPEQLEQVETILEESRSEAEALREEMAPRVRAHMEATSERIRQVLDPEQRAGFEKMMQRQRRLAERGFLGPGPGPGRRGRPQRRQSEPGPGSG